MSLTGGLPIVACVVTLALTAVQRLRRGRGETPWVTELACFLINAQGEVLEIVRANDPHSMQSGDGNVVIKRQQAREVTEKELLTFSLANVHPFVEVIGLMVTYSDDEIAHYPTLNEFYLTGDLCERPEEEAVFRGEKPLRVVEYHHNPKNEVARTNSQHKARKPPNFFAVCKFFRNHQRRNEWLMHSIAELGTLRSSINATLAESMQIFLLDIIPEIEIPNRNALNNVPSICAALSCEEFLGIESYFSQSGMTKEEFSRVILYQLLHARPELQRPARASALVALLFEMFEQIDINGDTRVDWEELTTFCISLGLISTRAQDLGSTGLLSLAYRQLPPTSGRYFAYQLRQIRSFPLLKRIAVIENKSSVVLIYDPEMHLLHEMTCIEKAAGNPDGFAILDIEHVPAKNAFAVSSNDHAITVWSIINPTIGAYVFSMRIVTRYPVISLHWLPSMRRLSMTSAEHSQLWDLDGQRAEMRLTHHTDRITDCLELPGSPYFVTSSFDRSIAFWDQQSVKVAFTLECHTQAVLKLDFLQHILLSSGFEHVAYCWNTTTRSLMMTLAGHHHSLIGAKFVSNRMIPTIAFVVTGDQSGYFRLWDISRCVKGYSTDLSVLLQTFDVHTNNRCQFHVFECGFLPSAVAADVPKNANREYEMCDIVTGNLSFYRFRISTSNEECAPPRHVAFNAVANTFVGSVDGCITVWNANSGVKMEEPILIRDAEVCGVVFDVPRERKLFIATSDGALRMYNPITGMLMTKFQIHDGVISSLLFCPQTNCLITTGFDRNICVSYSGAGRTDIEVLRCVENAHESCITTCGYSAPLDMVATGDDAGSIHVYDFQKLYLRFYCEAHHDEIRALHFHPISPLLISGDASGYVYLWDIASAHYKTTPLMRLTAHEYAPSTLPSSLTPHGAPATQRAPVHNPSSHASHVHLHGVTSICTTLENGTICVACEDGRIHMWDFQTLTNVARKRGVGRQFEPCFTTDDGDPNKSTYNPLLRVQHKTSVLKLKMEDVLSESLSDGIWFGGAERNTRHQSQALPSYPATHSWKAHDQRIFAIKAVPSPGILFSSSLDCAIKIWDGKSSCIGSISTVNRHSYTTTRQSAQVRNGHVASNRGGAPQTQSQPQQQQEHSPTKSASSAWKFTHHLVTDASTEHTKIAVQVIRKYKRHKQKELRQNVWTPINNNVPISLEIEDEALHSVQQPGPESFSDLEKRLPRPLPFTSESVRAGGLARLFGAEETRNLQDLARNSSFMSALKKKPQTPLLLSPIELQKFKRRSRTVQGNEHDLPVMRTMTHYPTEMNKRQTIRIQALRPLDIAPSQFLKDKLFDVEDLPDRAKTAAPKTTPKEKASLRMDASVVVLRDVSLRKMESSSSLTSLSTSMTSESSLRSSASMPVFITQAESELTSPTLRRDPMERSSSINDGLYSDPSNPQPKRSNIERKMKMYDDMTSFDGTPNDHGEVLSSPKPSLRASPSFRSSRSLLQQPQQPPPATPQPTNSQPGQPPSAGADTANNNPKVLTTRRSERKRDSATGTEDTAPNPFGPHYTVKQVVEFGAVITGFDSDSSGDLDQQEWVQMLQSCRKLFMPSEIVAAERLFHSIDRDGSGKISLDEILPAIFSKATVDQLQKMRQYIRSSIAKANSVQRRKTTVG
ncbi:TPA: hypothetical protein N0F65_001528 [Lagenidium giganteum]|uniref:EF-hand domain-containing protein n=1 Tax=Lagenidium giganteum TaxID=4803 RepID=A0AAV2Z4Q8_9STRA|nr:TPA: hypothetical protein N0F65_001528 [Lagenidium giganteum]